MQKNKFVFISPFTQTIVAFRGELISKLIENGHQVYVLSPDYTTENKEDVKRLGAIPVDYTLDRTGMNPVSDTKTIYLLHKKLKQLNPDTIFCYNPKPVIYGLIASSFLSIKNRFALIEGLGFAFTESGSFSIKRIIARFIMKRLYKTALSKADKVFFLNDDDEKEFKEYGLIQSGKSKVIGGIGVNLNEWEKAHTHTEPITFTLAARLLKEKGIIEYVEAAKLIKEKYPEVKFLLLGAVDDNPSAVSMNQLQQWKNESIIECPGRVSNIKDYYKNTSVYVLPSYREGVPRSTQEAMAIGRAVITTDVPGCRETVIDGVNGFMVPPRDVKSLAESMEKFITNPDLIKSMGESSRKLAEEKFDVNVVNKILTDSMF